MSFIIIACSQFWFNSMMFSFHEFGYIPWCSGIMVLSNWWSVCLLDLKKHLFPWFWNVFSYYLWKIFYGFDLKFFSFFYTYYLSVWSLPCYVECVFEVLFPDTSTHQVVNQFFELRVQTFGSLVLTFLWYQ